MVTMEDLDRAIKEIIEIWDGIAVSVTKIGEMLQKIFDDLYYNPQNQSAKNGIQHGKCLRRKFSDYRYIPVTPRNRPYQRRFY